MAAIEFDYQRLAHLTIEELLQIMRNDICLKLFIDATQEIYTHIIPAYIRTHTHKYTRIHKLINSISAYQTVLDL